MRPSGQWGGQVLGVSWHSMPAASARLSVSMVHPAVASYRTARGCSSLSRAGVI